MVEGKDIYTCQRVLDREGEGRSPRCGEPAVRWFIGFAHTLHPRCRECAIGWSAWDEVPREEVDAWLVMNA